MNIKNYLLNAGLIFLCIFSAIVNAEEFYTYPAFLQNANIKDDTLYIEAERDCLAFWAKCARELNWFKEWREILKWDLPYARWFEEGKLNACYNCLDRHLVDKANKIAFFWCSESGESRSISYSELHDEVCRLANAMKKLGITKGDRVAIYMPMVPEAIASMLACARIGAIHSVIFGGIGAGAAKEKIQDADAKLVITADSSYRRGKEIAYKQVIDTVLDDCPSVNHVIVTKRTGNPIQFNPERDHWYHHLIANHSSDCPCEWMDAEDILFLLYTSGTTGKAKGIIHTTGGYMVGVHNTFNWVFDIKPTDVYFCTADVGWITGHSYVVYGPMSNGVTQLIYEGAPDFPQKDQLWKIIEKYRATIFYTAPTLIRGLMKWGAHWIKPYDISSLRLIGSIGETLNPEAWQWFHQHIGQNKCPIVDTWFQTETGAFVIAPIPGLTPLKPGSISRALPGMQVAILNNNGELSSEGFLAITAPFPSMLRGVFKDPKRYYDTYWSKWNGTYYYAGDAAKQDADGYIWMHGRADEVIKVAGHRIGTAEVENALIQHPDVAETAVIGVKDELKGQVIVAFVVIRQGKKVFTNLEIELQNVVADYLGSYAKPAVTVVVKELPKTRSGKILRRLLLNLIQEEPLGDISTLENKQILDDLIIKAEEVRQRLKIQANNYSHLSSNF